jgi:putative transcriptional regulator
VREFGSSSLSLAGSILVAHPGLLDPNFRRSVIFLSANDPEEGSFGVVLTRPAGRKVSDLLTTQEIGALGHIPVLIGGPVSTDQLIFATFEWHPDTQRMDSKHHVAIEEAEAALKAPNTVVRAFVGYAGWSKGQLETELAQHAWLVAKPDRHILGVARSATLWRDTLSPFGPQFRLAAEAPDDPSRN